MKNDVIIPIWKKAPFIRLLLPLIAGILLQWYLNIWLLYIVTGLVSFALSFALFQLLPIAIRFKLGWLQGLIIQMLFVVAGMWLTWQNSTTNHANWYGNYYKPGNYLLVRIAEPPVEKAKSFKADGYVEGLIRHDSVIPVSGKILLYFSKDSTPNNLAYGDRIIINKALQPIKNSGNPGAFNYERYAAFQGIYHNVYLKNRNWTFTQGPGAGYKNPFWTFIFNTRAYVLNALQSTIHAGKDELGIAQALVIGYTNDLDKDLVQAYSNTGVVHVIAISGMHLGLIYVLITWILLKIPLINRSKTLQFIFILGSLWLFALLTGASPSVLRAAVMFTFIAGGKYLLRQASVYSSLAASAFVLLCYNPFYLWAVGFQLSYLAVAGILIFQKPIYNILYVRIKWLNKIWQLVCVSTAAQLLTFPVCIYYFHQFPNLFLFTNIVVVPLAVIILYTALALVVLSGVPVLGSLIGKLVGVLTGFMNSFILKVNQLPFAVWDRIPATVLSTWLLYAMVLGFCFWLLQKNKGYFQLALVSSFAFLGLTIFQKWRAESQRKLIVYNVPQHQAIDFVYGSTYQFTGDSILLQDGLLQNFHLKPARIYARAIKRTDTLPEIFHQDIFYMFMNKRIAIIDKPVLFSSVVKKIDLDLMIISKNPAIKMADVSAVFNCTKVVFDASNPLWKIEKWKTECRRLGLNFYSIPEEGAYIYDIGI